MTAVKLAPLILHPFSDPAGPGKLVESSRASLMLQGLLPDGGLTRQELDEALLDGRYCEIRMLFYVGKDLLRWMEQCLEIVGRMPQFEERGIRAQSFTTLLIDQPPANVAEKLRRWGVADYKAIFSRALGLNALFGAVPPREALAEEFIRSYYRYADQLYQCWQQMPPIAGHLDPEEFEYDLYASGEYSRMLERQWEEQ